MITIRCARCKRKIFKYIKVGKGRLWHCWKDRIKEDRSIQEEDYIKCQCGNVIGIDEGKMIKIKQHSITYTGTVNRK